MTGGVRGGRPPGPAPAGKTLVGVGVGPGDPELATVKAGRVLRDPGLVPVPGLGTSVSTLSVEISSRVSSAWTASPSRFSHRVTVPSETDTPICGMTTSIAVPVAT